MLRQNLHYFFVLESLFIRAREASNHSPEKPALQGRAFILTHYASKSFATYEYPAILSAISSPHSDLRSTCRQEAALTTRTGDTRYGKLYVSCGIGVRVMALSGIGFTTELLAFEVMTSINGDSSIKECIGCNRPSHACQPDRHHAGGSTVREGYGGYRCLPTDASD